MGAQSSEVTRPSSYSSCLGGETLPEERNRTGHFTLWPFIHITFSVLLLPLSTCLRFPLAQLHLSTESISYCGLRTAIFTWSFSLSPKFLRAKSVPEKEQSACKETPRPKISYTQKLKIRDKKEEKQALEDFEKLSLWGKCILSELGLPAHCSRKLSTPFPGTFRGRQTTPSALRFFSPEGFQPDFSFYKQMSRSTSGFPERRAEEPLSFLLFFPSHTTWRCDNVISFTARLVYYVTAELLRN